MNELNQVSFDSLLLLSSSPSCSCHSEGMRFHFRLSHFFGATIVSLKLHTAALKDSSPKNNLLSFQSTDFLLWNIKDVLNIMIFFFLQLKSMVTTTGYLHSSKYFLLFNFLLSQMKESHTCLHIRMNKGELSI